VEFQVPNRFVLLFLLWSGLIVCYFQRVALSVAIIPLAKKHLWEDDVQGLALSSFYWGYIIMQIPGGWLGQKFGGKLIMGISVVGSSLFTFFLTFFSSDFVLFLLCRVLTGFFEGMAYPITYHFLGLWFPESEKGTASGVISTSAPSGIVVAFLLSPFIIETLGWESVFWISGGLGLFWTVFWVLFTRNTPNDLSSISCLSLSPSEHTLLTRKNSPNNQKIPWKSILTSIPVQSFAINLFAFNWVKYITISWVPIYLVEDLGFRLDSTGLYSLLPYVISSVLTFVSGKIGDFIIFRGIFTTVTVRIIGQTLGLVLPSVGLVVLSAVETTPIQTVGIMIAAVSTTGFTGAGFVPNAIDLSSSYSGIIYAFGNTIGNIPGFLGVYLTGEILRLSDRNWAIVWLLATAINGVALVFCFLFFRGEEIDFQKENGNENICGRCRKH